MTKVLNVKRICTDIIDNLEDVDAIHEYLQLELRKLCSDNMDIYVESVSLFRRGDNDNIVVLVGDIEVSKGELNTDFTISTSVDLNHISYVPKEYTVQHDLLEEFISKTISKVSKETYCDDISLFTDNEIDKAITLLQQFKGLQGTTSDEAGLVLRVNKTTGRVFLVESSEYSEYKAFEINPNTNKIDELISCPNCGYEYYKSDVTENKCPKCNEEN